MTKLSTLLSIFYCVSLSTQTTLASPVSWPLLDSPVSYYASYTNVFGVGVLAHSSISQLKFQHTCAVLAAWLDNNQDGCTDNPQILGSLAEQDPRPVVVILPGQAWEEGYPHSEELLEAGMFDSVWLFDGEIHPECSGTEQTSDCVDATLEEVWHLVTAEGFSRIWVLELGERDSLMSEAMDIARGGHFEQVPEEYPSNAWYTYYDTTCEYECMATEYFYWAFNSWVGALQNQEDRIKDEWRPNTKGKMRETDIMMSELIEDTSQWVLPEVAPNGIYSASPMCEGGVGHGGLDNGDL